MIYSSKIKIILLCSLVFGIVSCRKPNLAPETHQNSLRFIHLAHTRTNDNPQLIPEVESIDFTAYDLVLLGGDLAASTTESESAISHVDSIFHFNQETTLWAIGNHDYNNLSLIEQYTQRPPYFAYNYQGITFIVLDTQDDFSNISGLQKEFFMNVVDTIEQSSQLIVLHHKLIWMYGDEYLEPLIPEVANGGLGDCFYCINPNNFYPEIYPKLVEVKDRGINVICVDIGFQTNQFEYTTPEGIHFLASGMSFNGQDNKALLFYYMPEKKRLDWQFVDLSSL